MAIKILIFSLIFLTGGIWFLSNGRSRYKRSWSGFGGLVTTPVMKFVVARFKPAQNSKAYVKLANNLGVLPVQFTMEEYYCIKTLIAGFILILSVSISLTNYNFAKNVVIKDTSVFKEISTGTVQTPIDQDKMAQLFNLVTSQININNELEANSGIAMTKISTLLSSGTDLPDGDIQVIAKVIVNKQLQINDLFSYKNFSYYLIAMMVGFTVPNLIVKIYANVRKKSYDNEVYNLEILVVLLSSMENVTVKYVIDKLVENAVLFKPLLRDFNHMYSRNRVNAYKFIVNSGINMEFEKLINILRTWETGSKPVAIESLQRTRASREEFSKMDRESKLENKDLICLVAYFVVFILLVAVFLAPWSQQLNALSLT